jgi:hypothetical protein
MSKYCHYDKQKIEEEINSIELRTFFQYGKSCIYYHNLLCLIDEVNGGERPKKKKGGKR